MSKITNSFLSIAFLLAAQVVFACNYPAKISVANGATATKEEMIASQTAVKKFVADMEIYLACIVDEEKSARAMMGEMEAEQEQQREEMLNKKYNAGVEQMEKVAAAFNSEVQAYKARDDG